MKKLLIIFFILLILPCSAAGQGKVADSLLKFLNTAPADTQRVNALNDMSRQTIAYPDSSYVYAAEAMELSKRLGFTRGLARAYGNIGEVYNAKGNYNLALKNLYDSYHLYEKLNDTKKMNSVMYTIGNTHMGTRNNKLALASFSRSYTLAKEDNDEKQLALASFGVGNIYSEMGKKDSAMFFLREALRMFEKQKFTYAEAMTYTAIGQIQNLEKDHAGSLASLEKGMELFKKIDQLYGIGVTYQALGSTYYDMGIKNKSLENYLLAYEVHLKRKAYDNLKEVSGSISKVYKDLGDYRNALIFHERYSVYNDSVSNEQSRKQLLEVETQYQTEKKEKEIQLKNLALEKSHAEVKNRTMFLYVFIAVSVIFLIMAFFVYRQYRQKKIANQEIIFQKNIIEEKNKNITDSIRYAQYIQESILPDADTVFQLLRESFVFYRPKDIVSGDFYWIHSADDLVYVAVVDCTGHGVPGAFMSMVGHNSLNNAVKQLRKPDTSEVLSFLQEEVTGLFRNNYRSATVSDGMDLSLVRLDRKLMKLQFSGANNPVCIVRNDELIEYKGDKKAISANQVNTVGGFRKHEIDLQKGDAVYLFSDGYLDQFGGPKGKKFKYKQFQELLRSQSRLPMNAQRTHIEKTIEAWSGNLEQIDDILVIGFRI